MHVSIQNTNHYLIEPNVCPHCHVRHQPEHYAVYQSRDGESNSIIVISVWRCSNDECKKIIVVQHAKVANRLPISKYLTGLPKGPDWPHPIRNLRSATDPAVPSKFIKTYLQSLQAESEALDEIAGMGYRKAIEYLVKDWATQLKPEDKDTIHSNWLGKVISAYFDGDLKEILERATWLGNDQAHYSKLFEEFDISVLKELIDLIMVELDRQYKKKQFIETITSRKL